MPREVTLGEKWIYREKDIGMLYMENKRSIQIENDKLEQNLLSKRM